MNFLFAAYTAIWLLLSWYIIKLARSQRRVEAELDRLEQKLNSIRIGSRESTVP